MNNKLNNCENKYSRLVESENVRGVISLNQDFELKRRWTPSKEEWSNMNVEHLQLPTKDFLFCPEQHQFKQAVQFIIKYVVFCLFLLFFITV